MRIISGIYGGRKINGKIPAGVRPTSDLARESIFNKLSHLIDIDEKMIADVCAGTGAMGIECLSRGAKHCVFVDSSRKSCDFIRQTMNELKIDKEQYSVLNKKSEKFPAFIQENYPDVKFDIIITDPPYISNTINQLLQDVVDNNLLNEEGIIIAEYASTAGIILPEELQLIDERQFGETQISYIEYK